jgi:hypothetical protein
VVEEKSPSLVVVARVTIRVAHDENNNNGGGEEKKFHV